MIAPHRHSDYLEHRRRGPFPGRIDPWAEIGHYFHQIHGGMLDDILTQIQDPVEAMGYLVGREPSLQIMGNQFPDVFIQRGDLARELRDLHETWDYAKAAVEILAEPGISAVTQDLYALHIRDDATNRLVTVIEVISPNNKTKRAEIAQYQDRRQRAITTQGINIVEIDLTRSVKRLFSHPLTAQFPYHIAVHLPERWPVVIGIELEAAPKRIAIPLRGAVVPLDLNVSYQTAYRKVSTAGQIDLNGDYTLDALPFPSTLTDSQREEALKMVGEWQAELERLRGS
ncbi:MAG: DUF4058 family protein [bacterium]|nr:DUF4058 family protein [bacterium]